MTFKYNEKEIVTLGDFADLLYKIINEGDQAEADKFIKSYSEAFPGSYKSNINYMFGHTDNKIVEKGLKMFNLSPVYNPFCK